MLEERQFNWVLWDYFRQLGRFRRAFEIAQYADWEEALGDDEEKPIARDPDRFRILVTGGAGKHSCVVPSWGMTASATLPLAP